MNNPKISVLMSTYNEPLKWVTESIDSILNQTLEDFEFIIINDNPKRKELANFLNRYKKKDKRIVLIKNKENIGLTKSLNKGLKTAKGKYIARMDADDISLPERFQMQYDYLESYPDTFLIGAQGVEIDKNSNFLRDFNRPIGFEEIKSGALNSNIIHHPTIMFRNERNNFYREKFRYSQDYDLYLRLISTGKLLRNLSDKLIKYRVNSISISTTNRTKQWFFAKKAKEFYFQRLKYGKDEYDKFDPNEMLNINVEKSTNRDVIESEIKFSFKLNNFKKVKEFCKKYFKHYGFFNKIGIYYLLSFLRKRTINFFRGLLKLIVKSKKFIGSNLFF